MATLLGRVLDLLANWRRPVVVAIHVGLICVSSYLAFLLRFDGAIPYPQAPLVRPECCRELGGRTWAGLRALPAA